MLHNALHTYESTSSTDNALLARTGRKHKHQNKQPEAKRRKNKLDASIPVDLVFTDLTPQVQLENQDPNKSQDSTPLNQNNSIKAGSTNKRMEYIDVDKDTEIPTTSAKKTGRAKTKSKSKPEEVEESRILSNTVESEYLAKVYNGIACRSMLDTNMYEHLKQNEVKVGLHVRNGARVDELRIGLNISPNIVSPYRGLSQGYAMYIVKNLQWRNKCSVYLRPVNNEPTGITDIDNTRVTAPVLIPDLISAQIELPRALSNYKFGLQDIQDYDTQSGEMVAPHLSLQGMATLGHSEERDKFYPTVHPAVHGLYLTFKDPVFSAYENTSDELKALVVRCIMSCLSLDNKAHHAFSIVSSVFVSPVLSTLDPETQLKYLLAVSMKGEASLSDDPVPTSVPTKLELAHVFPIESLHPVGDPDDTMSDALDTGPVYTDFVVAGMRQEDQGISPFASETVEPEELHVPVATSTPQSPSPFSTLALSVPVSPLSTTETYPQSPVISTAGVTTTSSSTPTPVTQAATTTTTNVPQSPFDPNANYDIFGGLQTPLSPFLQQFSSVPPFSPLPASPINPSLSPTYKDTTDLFPSLQGLIGGPVDPSDGTSQSSQQPQVYASSLDRDFNVEIKDAVTVYTNPCGMFTSCNSPERHLNTSIPDVEASKHPSQTSSKKKILRGWLYEHEHSEDKRRNVVEPIIVITYERPRVNMFEFIWWLSAEASVPLYEKNAMMDCLVFQALSALKVLADFNCFLTPATIHSFSVRINDMPGALFYSGEYTSKTHVVKYTLNGHDYYLPASPYLVVLHGVDDNLTYATPSVLKEYTEHLEAHGYEYLNEMSKETRTSGGHLYFMDLKKKLKRLVFTEQETGTVISHSPYKSNTIVMDPSFSANLETEMNLGKTPLDVWKGYISSTFDAVMDPSTGRTNKGNTNPSLSIPMEILALNKYGHIDPEMFRYVNSNLKNSELYGRMQNKSKEKFVWNELPKTQCVYSLTHIAMLEVILRVALCAESLWRNHDIELEFKYPLFSMCLDKFHVALDPDAPSSSRHEKGTKLSEKTKNLGLTHYTEFGKYYADLKKPESGHFGVLYIKENIALLHRMFGVDNSDMYTNPDLIIPEWLFRKYVNTLSARGEDARLKDMKMGVMYSQKLLDDITMRAEKKEGKFSPILSPVLKNFLEYFNSVVKMNIQTSLQNKAWTPIPATTSLLRVNPENTHFLKNGTPKQPKNPTPAKNSMPMFYDNYKKIPLIKPRKNQNMSKRVSKRSIDKGNKKKSNGNKKDLEIESEDEEEEEGENEEEEDQAEAEAESKEGDGKNKDLESEDKTSQKSDNVDDNITKMIKITRSVLETYPLDNCEKNKCHYNSLGRVVEFLFTPTHSRSTHFTQYAQPQSQTSASGILNAQPQPQTNTRAVFSLYNSHATVSDLEFALMHDYDCDMYSKPDKCEMENHDIVTGYVFNNPKKFNEILKARRIKFEKSYELA